MHRYLEHTITKAELTDEFFSREFTELREEFVAHTAAMKDLLTRYVDELYLMRDLLWAGYVDLNLIRPQIIDDQRMEQVSLPSFCFSI